MKLSAHSAQRIVVEIGNVVGQNINMMDENGYIIASTDPSRIGWYHEGAARIVEEKLQELYIQPHNSTNTARAGLNLPITHQGEIVGVIGITGDYENVIGYGQVVKKMTEILIREGTEQDEKKLDLRVRSRFLEDWVLAGALAQGHALYERGLSLGIDITLPRRVMVVSAKELDQLIDTAEGQKTIEQVETAVAEIVEAERGNIILRNAARQILLVRARSHGRMDALARQLCTDAQQRFGVRLSVGIDGTHGDVHKSYVQANKAWGAARMSPGQVVAYSQVTLDLFVGEISRQTKEEFVRKVFGGCSYEELCRWVRILQAYFEAQGSIGQAAQALYMHKNTLQYKLRKLEELTGYDVRLPSHAPVFYMALLFSKEVESSFLLAE